MFLGLEAFEDKCSSLLISDWRVTLSLFSSWIYLFSSSTFFLKYDIEFSYPLTVDFKCFNSSLFFSISISLFPIFSMYSLVILSLKLFISIIFSFITFPSVSNSSILSRYLDFSFKISVSFLCNYSHIFSFFSLNNLSY